MKEDLIHDTFDPLPNPSGLPRSKGIHLTQIIRYLERSMGLTYESFQEPWLTMDCGFTWEECLEAALAHRLCNVTRPGEMFKDGIYFSPDGEGDDPYYVYPKAVHEYKFTWMSSNKPPSYKWNWMTQGKGYCYGCETPVIVFHVAHVMGNYRGTGPLYREYRIEYDEYELIMNWDMLIRGRDELIEQGVTDEQSDL